LKYITEGGRQPSNLQHSPKQCLLKAASNGVIATTPEENNIPHSLPALSRFKIAE
jgi:hypothetical protein